MNNADSIETEAFCSYRRAAAVPAPDADAVCRKYMWVVYAAAKRFKFRGSEWEDLIQAGSLGLVKAVNRLMLTKNRPEPTHDRFVNAAFAAAESEIRAFIRNDRLVHIPRSAMSEISRMIKTAPDGYGAKGTDKDIALKRFYEVGNPILLETIDDFSSDGSGYVFAPEERSFEDSAVERIAAGRALDTLGVKERRVILARYRFGFTQKRTAELLGMSQGQVSKAEKRILAKLKAMLSE